MNLEFLDILVEPKTHLPLVLKNAVYEGEEIEEGILYSLSGNSYPIINGIPRFVAKDDMTRKQRYEEAVLDTFDMLSPQYDNPVDIHRVINTLNKCDIKNYEILSKHPVNIVGER